MRLLAAAALAVSLTTAPALAQAPPPDAAIVAVSLPPDLDRVLRDYERAWTARDPEALSRLFVEDGFVLANGRPPVRGRAAIREAYAGAGGPLHLTALAFATGGDTGYVIGTYAGGTEHPPDGKFVLALQRDEGGRWLIAADIDNTNRRPTGAPTAPGG